MYRREGVLMLCDSFHRGNSKWCVYVRENAVMHCYITAFHLCCRFVWTFYVVFLFRFPLGSLAFSCSLKTCGSHSWATLNCPYIQNVFVISVSICHPFDALAAGPGCTCLKCQASYAPAPS